MRTLIFTFFIAWIFPNSGLFGQVVSCSVNEPPKQGNNLTHPDDVYLTKCTNTANTITFTDPMVMPSAGNDYVIWVRYSNGNSTPYDCNELKDISGCVITTDVVNNSFTIQLPTGASLPDGYLAFQFKIWVNFKHSGSSTWQYWYHRQNGAGDYVFPVQFTSFTGVNTSDGYFLLTWKTAQEFNSDYFDIEISTDGINFSLLGRELAAGESNSELTYNFYALIPNSGRYNYRVKQVDFDGKVTLGPRILVASNNGSTNNPTTICGKTWIAGPTQIGTLGTYTYRLHNSAPNLSCTLTNTYFPFANTGIASLSTSRYGLVATVTPSAAGTMRLNYSNVPTQCLTYLTITAALVNCSNITIQGPDYICSGSANYYLSSYVGTNNTWSFNTNNCNATLYNTTGTTNTLTKVDWDGDGQVQIQVALEGCTNATKYKYKTVTMGYGTFSGYYYPAPNGFSQTLYQETRGNNDFGTGTNLVRVESPTGNQSWQMWASSSSSGMPVTYSYGTDGFLRVVMPDGGAYAEFQLTIPTSCGNANYWFEFSSYGNNYYYMLSPNPVSSEVTVAVDEQKAKKLKSDEASALSIRKIIIVNKFGNAVLQSDFTSNTRKATINVSSLPTDLYLVKIFDGKSWIPLKMIKK